MSRIIKARLRKGRAGRAFCASVLWLLLFFLLFSPAGGEEGSFGALGDEEEAVLADMLNLKAVQVVDPRFPALSEEGILEVVNAAQKTLKRKFDLLGFQVTYTGTISVKEFMERYIGRGMPEMGSAYDLFGENDFEPYKASIMTFLSQWSLDALKNAMPEELRSDVKSYSDYYEILTRTYREKMEQLKELTLPSGERLITRESAPYQSFVNWVQALYNQEDYDLVISNTLIYYDDMEKPFPHTVFKYAKVGGGSFQSMRENAFNRVILLNIFEQYTDLEYFTGGRKKEYEGGMRDLILGTVYLAHEVGHAVFLIPDVYDHDPGCLMDGSVETLDDLIAYREITADYPRCRKCAPYVVGREHALLATHYLRRREGDKAAYHYRQAMVNTPEFIDGNYESYMDDLHSGLMGAISLQEGGPED